MSASMGKLPIVVMTANSWRHRYVANRLMENFDVLGVVSEVKRSLKSGETEEDNQVILEHSRERDLKEREYFGKEEKFNIDPKKVLSVDYDKASGQEVFDWVNGLKPKYIALFGTSIIKDPILSAYENKIVNMHLGLSPYYRGSATTFWPLVFNEPECLGVTVHLAVLKVDAGAILGQARPDSKSGDGPHDIGHKNIIAGTDLMIRCINGFDAGKIVPQPQRLDIGKVFKHKDFNAQYVLKMKENFSNGMIDEYLRNKKERDAKYPIIEY